VTAPKFRDARALHISADRRKPFGHIGERRPEPVKLTANQVSLRMLGGLLAGVLLTLALVGKPW
jgi:hypothetical protein